MKNGKKGFTLLEVLLSLAILSYALISLIILQNQAIDLTIHANNLQVATMIAREKMSELMLKEKSFDMISDRRTPLADSYPQFTVKGDVIEDAVLPIELSVKVKELKVSVTWEEGGAETGVDLVTYVLAEERKN